MKSAHVSLPELLINGPSRADCTIVLAHGAGGRIASLVADDAGVSSYDLSSAITMRWLPDGDHSFTPRKVSGRAVEENWQDGVEAVDAFVKSLPIGRRHHRAQR